MDTGQKSVSDANNVDEADLVAIERFVEKGGRYLGATAFETELVVAERKRLVALRAGLTQLDRATSERSAVHLGQLVQRPLASVVELRIRSRGGEAVADAFVASAHHHGQIHRSFVQRAADTLVPDTIFSPGGDYATRDPTTATADPPATETLVSSRVPLGVLTPQERARLAKRVTDYGTGGPDRNVLTYFAPAHGFAQSGKEALLVENVGVDDYVRTTAISALIESVKLLGFQTIDTERDSVEPELWELWEPKRSHPEDGNPPGIAFASGNYTWADDLILVFGLTFLDELYAKARLEYRTLWLIKGTTDKGGDDAILTSVGNTRLMRMVNRKPMPYHCSRSYKGIGGLVYRALVRYSDAIAAAAEEKKEKPAEIPIAMEEKSAEGVLSVTPYYRAAALRGSHVGLYQYLQVVNFAFQKYLDRPLIPADAADGTIASIASRFCLSLLDDAVAVRDLCCEERLYLDGTSAAARDIWQTLAVSDGHVARYTPTYQSHYRLFDAYEFGDTFDSFRPEEGGPLPPTALTTKLRARPFVRVFTSARPVRPILRPDEPPPSYRRQLGVFRFHVRGETAHASIRGGADSRDYRARWYFPVAVAFATPILVMLGATLVTQLAHVFMDTQSFGASINNGIWWLGFVAEVGTYLAPFRIWRYLKSKGLDDVISEDRIKEIGALLQGTRRVAAMSGTRPLAANAYYNIFVEYLAKVEQARLHAIDTVAFRTGKALLEENPAFEGRLQELTDLYKDVFNQQMRATNVTLPPDPVLEQYRAATGAVAGFCASAGTPAVRPFYSVPEVVERVERRIDEFQAYLKQAETPLYDAKHANLEPSAAAKLIADYRAQPNLDPAAFAHIVRVLPYYTQPTLTGGLAHDPAALVDVPWIWSLGPTGNMTRAGIADRQPDFLNASPDVQRKFWLIQRGMHLQVGASILAANSSIVPLDVERVYIDGMPFKFEPKVPVRMVEAPAGVDPALTASSYLYYESAIQPAYTMPTWSNYGYLIEPTPMGSIFFQSTARVLSLVRGFSDVVRSLVAVTGLDVSGTRIFDALAGNISWWHYATVEPTGTVQKIGMSTCRLFSAVWRALWSREMPPGYDFAVICDIIYPTVVRLHYTGQWNPVDTGVTLLALAWAPLYSFVTFAYSRIRLAATEFARVQKDLPILSRGLWYAMPVVQQFLRSFLYGGAAYLGRYSFGIKQHGIMPTFVANAIKDIGVNVANAAWPLRAMFAIVEKVAGLFVDTPSGTDPFKWTIALGVFAVVVGTLLGTFETQFKATRANPLRALGLGVGLFITRVVAVWINSDMAGFLLMNLGEIVGKIALFKTGPRTRDDMDTKEEDVAKDQEPGRVQVLLGDNASGGSGDSDSDNEVVPHATSAGLYRFIDMVGPAMNMPEWPSANLRDRGDFARVLAYRIVMSRPSA